MDTDYLKWNNSSKEYVLAASADKHIKVRWTDRRINNS